MFIPTVFSNETEAEAHLTSLLKADSNRVTATHMTPVVTTPYLVRDEAWFPHIPDATISDMLSLSARHKHLELGGEIAHLASHIRFPDISPIVSTLPSPLREMGQVIADARAEERLLEKRGLRLPAFRARYATMVDRFSQIEEPTQLDYSLLWIMASLRTRTLVITPEDQAELKTWLNGRIAYGRLHELDALVEKLATAKATDDGIGHALIQMCKIADTEKLQFEMPPCWLSPPAEEAQFATGGSSLSAGDPEEAWHASEGTSADESDNQEEPEPVFDEDFIPESEQEEEENSSPEEAGEGQDAQDAQKDSDASSESEAGEAQKEEGDESDQDDGNADSTDNEDEEGSSDDSSSNDDSGDDSEDGEGGKSEVGDEEPEAKPKDEQSKPPRPDPPKRKKVKKLPAYDQKTHRNKKQENELQEKVKVASQGTFKTRANILNTRLPEHDDHVLASGIAKTLRQARWRAPKKYTKHSKFPPGRLDTRAALTSAAQRDMGIPVTAEPFRQVIRKKQEGPPVIMGLMCDVSGSMQESSEPMGQFAWACSHAVPRAGGKFASVIFGHTVQALAAPGERLKQVPLFKANAGYENAGPAFASLGGGLQFFGRVEGVKVLIISSDGYWRNAQVRQGIEWIRQLEKHGVHVFWLPFAQGVEPQHRMGGTLIELETPSEAPKVLLNKINEEVKKA